MTVANVFEGIFFIVVSSSRRSRLCWRCVGAKPRVGCSYGQENEEKQKKMREKKRKARNVRLGRTDTFFLSSSPLPFFFRKMFMAAAMAPSDRHKEIQANR